MTDAEIAAAMGALEGWSCEGDALVKTFRFADHLETMAFVNAAAWIAHRLDHHPDVTVGYNQCTVAYTTLDAGGLTPRDFAGAARIDALFEP